MRNNSRRNCPRCGQENGKREPYLCRSCEDAAYAEYLEWRNLFVDSNIARDTKRMMEELDAEE